MKLLKAALINYVLYFKKFIKCLIIISLSVLLFYIVFNLTVYLPIKNDDREIYSQFVDAMELYITNLTASAIFSADFMSKTIEYVRLVFEATNPDLNAATILIVFSSLIIIGAFVYSQLDCKKSIKERIKNKDTVNVVKQILIKSILNIAFWILFFIITYYWFFAIFLLPFILVIIEAFKTLISTWYIYFRKYNFFQFVNLGNSIRIVITNFVLMYLHALIFFYLAPHISLYFLLLLALTSFAYTSSITEFTATKYFISKRKSNKLDMV